MYKGKKIILVAAAYNEEGKIGKTVKQAREKAKFLDEIVVVNDGSADATEEEARRAGATVVSHKVNQGAGAAYRTGYFYGLENGYDIIVEIAGDNQDDPSYIENLINPIIEEGYDYVHGSRYKLGKKNTQPFFRLATTNAYSLLFSIIAMKRITDASNGFRAFRVEILRGINLKQEWLNRYELEPYFLLQVIKKGFKVKEVGAPKYFHDEKSYSKMIPLLDWWSILRPLFLVTLRIKK